MNTESLSRFVEQVKHDPSQARKTKRVVGEWVFEEGRPQFTSTLEYPGGKLTLSAELPPFAGGWGTSPDPLQYCLYGLAACFATTIMGIAAAEGIRLTRLEVAAENEVDLRKMIGLSEEEIIKRVRLVVKADGASPPDVKRIVELAEKRCPGVECVTRPLSLGIEIVK